MSVTDSKLQEDMQAEARKKNCICYCGRINWDTPGTCDVHGLFGDRFILEVTDAVNAGIKAPERHNAGVVQKIEEDGKMLSSVKEQLANELDVPVTENMMFAFVHLNALTEDERQELLGLYCHSCGCLQGRNPGRPEYPEDRHYNCQCWNDE